jgi:hypothetical protein
MAGRSSQLAQKLLGRYSCELFEMVGGKSVDVRPQEPAQIKPDAERIAAQLQWNAAANIKFEIQITDQFVVNTGIESVVAHEVGGADDRG